MTTVTIHEAKTHLSRLLKRALEGEDIVIARGALPLVRLVPLASARRSRRLGTASGMLEMAEDFDEPLDDFSDYQ